MDSEHELFLLVTPRGAIYKIIYYIMVSEFWREINSEIYLIFPNEQNKHRILYKIIVPK